MLMPTEITEDTTPSWTTWERTPWTYFQIIMGIEEAFDIEIAT